MGKLLVTFRFFIGSALIILGLVFLLLSISVWISLAEHYSGIHVSDTFDAGPAMGQFQFSFSFAIPMLISGLRSFSRALVKIKPPLTEKIIGKIAYPKSTTLKVLLNPIVLLMLSFILSQALFILMVTSSS